ncbi:MAG: hypothetical protein JWN34_3010 [Bryobacterales bacterium]|nr:hypothetical protein [Bryobacterales bacterium]
MNALFAALVNGAVASALTVALVGATLRLTPRRVVNATTRYAIWWIAMILTVVTPVSFLPNAVPPLAEIDASSMPTGTQIVSTPTAITADAPAVARPRHVVPPQAPSSLRAPKLPFELADARWPRTILLVWAAIGLLCLARVAIGFVLMKRLAARAIELPSTVTRHFEAGLSWASRFRSGVRITATPEVGTPVAIGPWNPSILIPADLCERLNEAELNQIGLHEAAHLVRRDDCALLVQRLIEAVFAIHPIVRWIARNIDLEREIACDDLVVAATGSPTSYANCLVRVIELSSGVRASLTAATAAEDNSHLARRIGALLDRTRNDKTSLVKTRLAIVSVLAAASTVMAVRVSTLVAFATPPAPRNAHASQLYPGKVTIAPLQAASTGPSPNLAGKVLEDSTGAPVASAELRFRRAGMRELAADIETHRQGRFIAPELPAGEYSIEVRKPNFVNTGFRLQLPSGNPTVRLVRYGVIEGQVSDEQGHPLPARVFGSGGRSEGYTRVIVLAKLPGESEPRIFREAEIMEGHYRVYDLPPGDYQLGLWYNNLSVGSGTQLYPDSAHPRLFTVLGGEEYLNVNFTAVSRPAWQVSGKVLLPDGVKGRFQLALGLPDQRMLPVATTLSADDGSFRFGKIPAGNYQLFASGPTGGYGAYESILGDRGEPLFGRMQLQVAGSNLDDVQVPLSKGGTLNVILKAAGSGRVPEGCPQTTTIAPQPMDSWGLMYLSTISATFGKEQSLAGVPPGRFRLAARELGPTCFQVSQPVVDAGADPSVVAIELASAGTIEGTLKSSGTGAFGIVLVPLGAVEGTSSLLAFPNPDGRFRFDSVRPGDYRISAQPVADARARWMSKGKNAHEIDVKGGAITNVDLTVTPEGSR